MRITMAVNALMSYRNQIVHNPELAVWCFSWINCCCHQVHQLMDLRPIDRYIRIVTHTIMSMIAQRLVNTIDMLV